MDIDNDVKRLFFAFEVNAPWPEQMPEGRILHPQARHLTAVFLGNISYNKLQNLLPTMPIPPMKVGVSGFFNKILFLPPQHPRVVAWHAEFYQQKHPFDEYVHRLRQWCKDHQITLDKHEEFLPHVTLCRAPFPFHHWREHFHVLPLTVQNFHLYESMGNMRYVPLWTRSILPPFQELEHTADIAFQIRGESLQQIYENAATALAFKYPLLLKYKQKPFAGTSIDDVIMELNLWIGEADADVGCPFKAICFHGEIIKESDNTLSWEMIVDV